MEHIQYLSNREAKNTFYISYHAKMRASQAPIIEVPPTGINFERTCCFPLIALTYRGAIKRSCPTIKPPAAIFRGKLGVEISEQPNNPRAK
jgi:hypothetical protein